MTISSNGFTGDGGLGCGKGDRAWGGGGGRGCAEDAGVECDADAEGEPAAVHEADFEDLPCHGDGAAGVSVAVGGGGVAFDAAGFVEGEDDGVADGEHECAGHEEAAGPWAGGFGEAPGEDHEADAHDDHEDRAHGVDRGKEQGGGLHTLKLFILCNSLIKNNE